MTKQETVQHYARHYKLFIDTGTFGGDMVQAVLDPNHVMLLFTIEIDKRMYQEAELRFDEYGRVVCLHGDSATVLPKLLVNLKFPALFWLDGHYSGPGTARGEVDSPVKDELLAIRDWAYGDQSMILCDDAGMFQGKDGYPTIEEIRGLFPDRQVQVADDIIRIFP